MILKFQRHRKLTKAKNLKLSKDQEIENYRNLCKTKYVRLPSSMILHAHAPSYVDITVYSPDVAVSKTNPYTVNVHITSQ